MSGGNVQKVLVGRRRPAACRADDAYAVRRPDINTSYTIYLLTEQKMRAWPWCMWARTWTCCWSCATGSSFVRRPGLRVVDARTTDKLIGALMTLVNKGGKADE